MTRNKFRMIARGLTLTQVRSVLKIMDLETSVNLATELIRVWRSPRYKPHYPHYGLEIEVEEHGCGDMEAFIRRQLWQGFRRVRKEGGDAQTRTN